MLGVLACLVVNPLGENEEVVVRKEEAADLDFLLDLSGTSTIMIDYSM